MSPHNAFRRIRVRSVPSGLARAFSAEPRKASVNRKVTRRTDFLVRSPLDRRTRNCVLRVYLNLPLAQVTTPNLVRQGRRVNLPAKVGSASHSSKYVYPSIPDS